MIERTDLPPDFFAEHFPSCSILVGAVCNCDEIERDMRADYADMRNKMAKEAR